MVGALGKPAVDREPGWKLFLEQFKSLLILILLAASALAAIVGDVKDAVVIFGVVLVNTTLGYRQEHRAEAAVAALKRMLVGTARVRRAGRSEVVEVEQLVPGDIVLIEAGDRIPADGRIVRSHHVEASTCYAASHSSRRSWMPSHWLLRASPKGCLRS